MYLSKNPFLAIVMAVAAIVLSVATHLAADEFNLWSATLQLQGEEVGSAMSLDEVVIGVSSESHVPKPPVPPEYTVWLQLWERDWSGPWYQDVRGDGDVVYFWVVDVNPHGNMPPPPDRCATLSWDPAEFATAGSYILRDGFSTDGPVLIADMRTTTSQVVCGSSSSQHFVIQYTSGSSGPACGDVDGSGSLNLSDAIALVNYIFGIGEPAIGGNKDVNCDGSISMSDVVYLIWHIFGTGSSPCDPDGDGLPDC